MKKNCTQCGAPLSNNGCDYCGYGKTEVIGIRDVVTLKGVELVEINTKLSTILVTIVAPTLLLFLVILTIFLSTEGEFRAIVETSKLFLSSILFVYYYEQRNTFMLSLELIMIVIFFTTITFMLLRIL